MLESFIKSLISVKTRPNANYIAGCGELLALAGAAELRDALLPALHKAVLRSPETVTEAVGAVFAALRVPLAGLALDIGKILIGSVLSVSAHCDHTHTHTHTRPQTHSVFYQCRCRNITHMT